MTARIKDNRIKALIYVALALALIFKSFFPLPLPDSNDRTEVQPIVVQ